MVDIGPSNPIIEIMDSTIDFPFSSSSLEPLTFIIKDRLNIRGNTICLSSKLEFVVQFDSDNHLVMRLRLVDARHIILLPFPEATSSTNPKEEDIMAFMLEPIRLVMIVNRPSHVLISNGERS